ncbi:hypothetical protein GGI64_004114 [Rhizobium leguminosarum]|uniref:Uncharacterized protein n=1 Tax=Rhizobium leguminosarum TaxID=384 RepID=A0A7Z0E1H6_RHILE|nr:hypothetical protein [Rhizobium leguminosarum]NYJ13033.1 hypothetical protein [Rhizobium leguminosarum]
MRLRVFIGTLALLVLVCSSASADEKTPGGSALPVLTDKQVVDQLKILTDTLTQLTPEKFKEISGASEYAKPLTAQLMRVDPVSFETIGDDAAGKMIKAAKDLKAKLSGASAPMKKFLQQSDTATESLNLLMMAIQDLSLGDPNFVVRVNEAKLGDTPERPVKTKRWCDATAYMRARCDRKQSCTLDANYQDLVCGFNPAPSADPRNRGLYVDYDCVSNVSEEFAKNYPTPKTDQGAEPAKSGDVKRTPDTALLQNEDRSKYVVIRGNGSLACSTALKPTSGDAAKK